MKSINIALLSVIVFGIGVVVGNLLPPLFINHAQPQVIQQAERSTDSVLMSGEVVQSLPDGSVLNASTRVRNPIGLCFVKGATDTSKGSVWRGQVLPAGSYENYADPAGRKIRLMQYLVIK